MPPRVGHICRRAGKQLPEVTAAHQHAACIAGPPPWRHNIAPARLLAPAGRAPAHWCCACCPHLCPHQRSDTPAGTACAPSGGQPFLRLGSQRRVPPPQASPAGGGRAGRAGRVEGPRGRTQAAVHRQVAGGREPSGGRWCGPSPWLAAAPGPQWSQAWWESRRHGCLHLSPAPWPAGRSQGGSQSRAARAV